MTIEDTNGIDGIATHPDRNEILLVISDHLDWQHVDSHISLLEDKINAYIAFVESGQLRNLKGKEFSTNAPVVVVLSAEYAPPPETKSFFENVTDVLSSIGLRFELRSEDRMPT